MDCFGDHQDFMASESETDASAGVGSAVAALGRVSAPPSHQQPYGSMEPLGPDLNLAWLGVELGDYGVIGSDDMLLSEPGHASLLASLRQHAPQQQQQQDHPPSRSSGEWHSAAASTHSASSHFSLSGCGSNPGGAASNASMLSSYTPPSAADAHMQVAQLLAGCAGVGGRPRSGPASLSGSALQLHAETAAITAVASAAAAAAAAAAPMAQQRTPFGGADGTTGGPQQQQQQQQQQQRAQSWQLQQQHSTCSELAIASLEHAPSTAAAASLQRTSRPSAAEAKPQAASHSTIEKQRRDRINSLIDQLRDLVPPQGPPATGSSLPPQPFDNSSVEAQKRPKHVVLADAIALVKSLRIDPQQQQQQQQYMYCPMAAQQHQQHCDLAVAAEQQQAAAVADASSPPALGSAKAGSALQPLMPHIPLANSRFSGVHVEPGTAPGLMYLQVKCRDRRHLLADITTALKSVPAEILSAAVTTNDDGVAVDQFEIRCDDTRVDAADVQNLVHEALYQQDAHKKQRL